MQEFCEYIQTNKPVLLIKENLLRGGRLPQH